MFRKAVCFLRDIYARYIDITSSQAIYHASVPILPLVTSLGLLSIYTFVKVIL